jgi:predicted flap endonuclease-1-like 5' DNA nuclease
MAKLKNVTGKEGKWTTIIGAIVALVAVLASLGVFTPEQQAALTENIPLIITGIAALIASIRLFIARDS